MKKRIALSVISMFFVLGLFASCGVNDKPVKAEIPEAKPPVQAEVLPEAPSEAPDAEVLPEAPPELSQAEVIPTPAPAPSGNNEPGKGGDNDPVLISEEAARKIALDRAGLTAAEVPYIETKLDRDDGKWEYEIEFKHGGFEYEVDVDAVTGAVLKFDKDYDD